MLNKINRCNARAKPYDVVVMFKTNDDIAATLQLLRRTGWSSAQRQEQLHAVPRIGKRRQSAKCKSHLAVPKGPDEEGGCPSACFIGSLTTCPMLAASLTRGQLVDASFVLAPRQRNTREEICEKGHRGHPLTDGQKGAIWVKTKTRSRVEHVLGFIEGAMLGLATRPIGFARACKSTRLTCLKYNPFRKE